MFLERADCPLGLWGEVWTTPLVAASSVWMSCVLCGHR